MPLYWFALLISVLFSASMNTDGFESARPLITAFGLLMLFGLASKCVALWNAMRVLKNRATFAMGLKTLRTQLEVLRWIWLPLAVATTALCLSPLLSNVPGPKDSMALRALLLLIPSFIAIGFTWISERQFTDWADAQHASAEFGQDERTAPSTIAFLADSFRMQCAWIVAPVLVVLGLMDVAELGFDMSGRVGTMAAGLIGLFSLPFVLPVLMSYIWPTTRIAEIPEHAWLANVVHSVGFRRIGIRLWDTDRRVCSALVAGFIPGFRVLLLSDSLLERLDRSGTIMVILHELAHISRWHMAFRMFALVPAWVIAGIVASALPFPAYADSIGMGLGVVLTCLALRYISHATELDADRHACRLAAKLEKTDDRYITEADAARALIVALQTVSTDNPKANKASWMHPSLAERVSRLEKLAATETGTAHSLVAHSA